MSECEGVFISKKEWKHYDAEYIPSHSPACEDARTADAWCVNRASPTPHLAMFVVLEQVPVLQLYSFIVLSSLDVKKYSPVSKKFMELTLLVDGVGMLLQHRMELRSASVKPDELGACLPVNTDDGVLIDSESIAGTPEDLFCFRKAFAM